MDYSYSADDSLIDSGKAGDEPEVVDESGESDEPENVNENVESDEPHFTESAQDVNAANNTAVEEKTPLIQQPDKKPTDKPSTNITYHGQPNGIEVPSSPEHEPRVDHSIRDFGMRSKGPGGGIEGKR